MPDLLLTPVSSFRLLVRMWNRVTDLVSGWLALLLGLTARNFGVALHKSVVPCDGIEGEVGLFKT